MSSTEKEKVVPPKKSKAARKTAVVDEKESTEQAPDAREQNGHTEDTGKVSDAASSSGPDQEQVNIFREQIVEGKRKRNAPLAEQTLSDWLNKNFVEKENSFLLLNDMYQSYLESCSAMAAFALDFVQFHKTVNQMFPKGQALVEDSPYKDAIRERKPKKKTAAKIQADSLNLKMKDIIKEAITDLGDPRKGVTFHSIRNLVAGKFPALRVDLRVNFLKNAINRELRLAHIQCVRGIGACGYYRLPRTSEQEASELEAEKKEAKEKALKKKEKLKKSGEEGEAGSENAEKPDADSEEKTDDQKSDKEKENAEDDEAVTKDKAKKKKKAHKRKQPQKEYYVAHSEPQRIEDTFSLAMTYNSEPKEASVAKIRKYLKDFYKEDVPTDRLKKCLDTGVEHGFWFQVTGHGSGSGSFRLTINEFDPLADDDLTGKVMNAIVACTEPKQSSALLLKKYVQDYHPNFRVAERPHLFKMALQRAVAKNKIVQLTGIGATGTFQLVNAFLPSPTVLQGKDTSDDEAEIDDVAGADATAYLDAYKPRPTKRRGMGRPGATAVDRLNPSVIRQPQLSTRAPKGRATKRAATTGRGRGASKSYAESSDESSDDESDEEPVKKAPAKRKAAPSPARGAKAKKPKVAASPVKRQPRRGAAQPKKDDTESISEEYDSEPEGYAPRKAALQGGKNSPQKSGRWPLVSKGKGQKSGNVDKVPETKTSPVTKGKASPAVKGKKAKATPKKPKGGRGRASVGNSSESRKEVSSPPKSSSPAKPSTPVSGRASSAARMRAQPPSEDDEEKEASQLKTPRVKITISVPAKGSPSGSGKKSKRHAAVLSEDKEDDESEDEKPAIKKASPAKVKAAGKKHGGKNKKSRK